MRNNKIFAACFIAYVFLAVLIILLPGSAVRNVGIAGLVVAWVGAVSFPPYFHFTVRWWESFMGQHVMAYSSVLAFALTNTLARVVFPELPWRLEAGVVVMWLVAGVLWWRIFAFRRAQREGGRLQEDESTTLRSADQ